MGSGRQTLTHRRAEEEPLLAWADMTSMKALEVSENFLMSTALGTLGAEERGSPQEASEEQQVQPSVVQSRKLDRAGALLPEPLSGWAVT